MSEDDTAPPARPRRTATRAAGPPAPSRPASEPPSPASPASPGTAGPDPGDPDAPKAPARTRRRRTPAASAAEPAAAVEAAAEPAAETAAEPGTRRRRALPPVVTFQAPPELPAAPVARGADPADEPPPPRKTAARRPAAAEPAAAEPAPGAAETGSDGDDADDGRPRRRRGRRGRGGGGGGATATPAGEPGEEAGEAATPSPEPPADGDGAEDGPEGTGSRRRRRRRRRRPGEPGEETGSDEATETTPRPRAPRAPRADRPEEEESEVRGVKGSTRLEAKRQRRRDGRDSGRRRAPILSEAEFLARREAVERIMVVREGTDRTQIAVLEDGVLVEHYVQRSHGASGVGNVYLGRVQNVLPSMEAAFVDVGRGRNAVLYAGEVNYDASALEGRPSRIEQALKSGQSVLVQVTKDPIGHKGARLTSQVSVPGRFMVYVPEGPMTGISRKLPDSERTRLKAILKKITPEEAGVIVRTAAEGASEEGLTRDLSRLVAQWEDIRKKAAQVTAPALVYAEPDLVIRVIRDIFNEDFAGLVVQGADEWDTVEAYVGHVAPDLAPRLSRWTGEGDVFSAHRIDEQLAKALDRKVWLPSGGYLVIDRTEAMIVVDVNTGKFTGKGGNLEETVTKNNLEAAEEIVRQLRLRDLGGIIVIDFIDMVLESNRDLVLRRLLECLGRDRTKHQVAEVTSLGLVQMTRKRIGEGLLEAFSENCPECSGRGVIVTIDPFGPGGEQPRRPKAVPAPPSPAPSPEPVAGQLVE